MRHYVIRRTKGLSILGVVLAILLFLGILWVIAFGYYEVRKAYWDYQVREMCAKDGGVTVFERISISKEESDHLSRVGGLLGVTTESLADSQSPALLKTTDITVRSGDPSILRHEQEIVRRSDRKIVAKVVLYVRSGGDIPSPAFPSSYHCPAVNAINQEISNVFKIKEFPK